METVPASPVLSFDSASARGGSPVHTPPRTTTAILEGARVRRQNAGAPVRRPKIRAINLQQILWDLKEAKRAPTDALGHVMHAVALLDETEEEFGNTVILRTFRRYLTTAQDRLSDLEELEGDRNELRRSVKSALRVARAAYSVFHERVETVDEDGI